MAWSYSTAHTDAGDVTLAQRVTVAVVAAALVVQAEDAATDNHIARSRLAHDVLRDPEPWAARMIWAVAADPETVKDSDDALRERVVRVWDAYAGVV